MRGSVSLARRARFRRTRFDAPKSASQPDNPKRGCSYRPFAPPHGLTVSGLPRRALHSRPDISPAAARQGAGPFGHPLPASTVSGLGADPRRLPVTRAERTASRLSLHRRSPPGLSSLGILALKALQPSRVAHAHGDGTGGNAYRWTPPDFPSLPFSGHWYALSDHRSGIATALTGFAVPCASWNHPHLAPREAFAAREKSIPRYVSTVFYLTYLHSDTMKPR